MTPLDALQTVADYVVSEVDDGAVKISGLGQIGVSAHQCVRTSRLSLSSVKIFCYQAFVNHSVSREYPACQKESA